jgi:hypothetical protein
MKHSELKQIIKEEIYKVLEVIDPRQSALDDFGTKIKKELGIKDREPGPSRNKFRSGVEKLPNYNILPEKRVDINYRDNNKPSIYLPSITSNGTTGIYSKEDAKNWVDEFTRLFGAPEFIVTGEKVEVKNPKYTEKQGLFRKALDSTQGD